MKKYLLVVGIIFLFLSSVVAPMTTGINTDSEVDVDPLRGYYGCYNLMEIPDNLRPILSEDDEFQDIPENIVNSQEPYEPQIGPPMDSAWPMYCHDVRHTGRSPYSTIGNNFFNKWWIKSGDDIEGSAVIDKDGVLYFFYVVRTAWWFPYFAAAYPNGTLKWKCEIEHSVYSSPVIADDGTIYVADRDSLYSINYNGTREWKLKIGGEIHSSPTIGDDGTIYIGNGGHHINAINPNGTFKWRYTTGLVVYSSPAIGPDGTVYCGSHDTYLYALYPNNGTLKWRYKTGHWVRVSPCIGDDGTIYCVSLDNYLHAVNPDGTLKWKTDVGAGTSPTIGQDGTIYAGYSKLYAVNPNGSVKWTFNNGGAIRGGTPCNSLDGTIIFGTNNEPNGGSIYAVNPNGTERWREKICDYGWGVEFAPIIGKDGTVYVGTSADEFTGPGELVSVGYLYAFNNMDSNAPSLPVIEGPANGNSKKSYNYTFKSTSPLGNDVYYYVDWNDGDWRRDCWIGPYGSGEEAVISHTWSYPGTYTIRTRCKDSENLWSDWSEKSVTIPRDKSIDNIMILRLLERFPLLERLQFLLN